jgi:hypothetical protein
VKGREEEQPHSAMKGSITVVDLEWAKRDPTDILFWRIRFEGLKESKEYRKIFRLVVFQPDERSEDCSSQN